MASFEVRIAGLESLRAVIASLPQRIRAAEGRIVAKLAAATSERLKRRLKGEDVKVRSGSLIRSAGFSGPETTAGGTLIARAGYGDQGPAGRYARITEEGGTITPKGRLLAMPIGIALTASGVARAAASGGKWLQNFPNGFWLQRPGRTPIFVQKAGRGFAHERLELIALGLRKATRKPTHALSKSAEEARSIASGIIEAEVRAALQAA